MSLIGLLIEIRVFIYGVTLYKSSGASCACGGDCVEKEYR